LTPIEHARDFLEAATLSDVWVAKMQNKALVTDVYHTIHIELTQLTLKQSEQLWKEKKFPNVNPADTSIAQLG